MKIVENFDSLLKVFDILRSFVQLQVYKIQHFRKCIYILSIVVCSLSGPGLAPSVHLNFNFIHITQSAR